MAEKRKTRTECHKSQRKGKFLEGKSEQQIAVWGGRERVFMRTPREVAGPQQGKVVPPVSRHAIVSAASHGHGEWRRGTSLHR